jgi:RNA polymerase sigma-70 factor (ECF subfamily)
MTCALQPAACDEETLRRAVHRVQAGDIAAFDALYDAFAGDVAADLVRRLPSRSDVQEVAQDAFVRLYRALPGYRFSSPLRAFVLGIVRRAAADFFRKRYRSRETAFSAFASAAADAADETDEERIDRLHAASGGFGESAAAADRAAEAGELVHRALAALSPDDRALVTLVELEDMPLADAAKEFGCSLAAVKVRVFRARKRLRKILETLQRQEDLP